MNKQENAEDMLRMYRSLTDPKEREKARQIEERRKRIEDKKKDTGMFV